MVCRNYMSTGLNRCLTTEPQCVRALASTTCVYMEILACMLMELINCATNSTRSNNFKSKIIILPEDQIANDLECEKCNWVNSFIFATKIYLLSTNSVEIMLWKNNYEII